MSRPFCYLRIELNLQTTKRSVCHRKMKMKNRRSFPVLPLVNANQTASRPSDHLLSRTYGTLQYSDTFTENLENSEEICRRKAGTTQAALYLVHEDLAEDLGETHSEAHKMFDLGVQELLRICCIHRRRDGHTAHTGGKVAGTFL